MDPQIPDGLEWLGEILAAVAVIALPFVLLFIAAAFS
jgi:uncharacterized protein involved in cysteine biosynthesis